MSIFDTNQPLSNKENLLLILQIMRTRNIGSITFQKLYRKYKDPERILREVKNILSQKGNEGYCPEMHMIEEELKRTEDFGANIISIFDEKYPAMLRQCEDPPIIITYNGNIEKVSDNNIGFVGARNCSANGVSLAYKFANELANKNYTVVSGLAKGIDTASHKGALEAENYDENSLPTIAVIGGGIDDIYPKENAELYKRIARDGLIITEYPFCTSPKAENFPKRNRIISALSKAVLIIEATLRSGSLITARTALEQNREVMCIPGFPLDERARGCNKLIKDGAHIITCVEDITEVVTQYREVEFNQPPRQNTLLESSEIDFEFEEVEENETPSEPELKEDGNITNILDYIGHSPVDINEVIKISGKSAAQINSFILENEIEGNLIRHPGNKVSKVG